MPPARDTGKGGMASGPGARLCLCQAGLWHPLTVPGPFACLAWSRSETRLLYVAEKCRPKPRPPCPWDVPGTARPAEEDEDEEVGATCPVSMLCTPRVCCVPRKRAA